MKTLWFSLFVFASVVYRSVLVEGDNQVKLEEIPVEDCGGDGNLQISRLAVAPYPIRFPSHLSLALEAKLQRHAKGPFRVSLRIYRKVLFWIKVPCIGIVGSCSYDDACQLMDRVFEKQADIKQHVEKLLGISLNNCNEINPFEIKLSQIIELPALGAAVNFFLGGGYYKVEVDVSRNEELLFCRRVYVQLD